MAAYAEGMNILHHANVGKHAARLSTPRPTPLRNPEHYQYDLNLADIAEVWRRGSVIASWLLDLAATALQDSPDLAKFAGRVSDSGEGRWTIMAAIDESVPGPGPQRRAVPAFQFARRGRLRGQAALRLAPRIRRPRRKRGGLEGGDRMTDDRREFNPRTATMKKLLTAAAIALALPFASPSAVVTGQAPVPMPRPATTRAGRSRSPPMRPPTARTLLPRAASCSSAPRRSGCWKTLAEDFPVRRSSIAASAAPRSSIPPTSPTA